MRTFAVLALVSFLSVGCAGKQQVTDLQTSLAACESEKSNLAAERDQLQAELDAAKKIADRANALADARKQNLEDLRNKLKALIDAGTLEIEVRHGVIVLKLPNEILFASGKADVKKDARSTLNQVAKALESIGDRRFYISGHTDTDPVKDKARKFRTNWELSTLRALGVQEILHASGMKPERTVVAGWGDTDPVAGNDTDDGKAKNRRTEIMLVPNLEALMPEVVAMAKEEGAAAPETEAAAE